MYCQHSYRNLKWWPVWGPCDSIDVHTSWELSKGFLRGCQPPCLCGHVRGLAQLCCGCWQKSPWLRICSMTSLYLEQMHVLRSAESLADTWSNKWNLFFFPWKTHIFMLRHFQIYLMEECIKKMSRNMGFGVMPGFKSWLCSLLTVSIR